MADRFANGNTANDTGGLTGGRAQTGLRPDRQGLLPRRRPRPGLTSKLDYIKGLGTTAIWLTPSFKNRPVQGTGADASAGYHGYWITDFTQVDPHLGTNDDMKTLIDAAHAQGDEGLLRHHHQPHRRRHRLRRRHSTPTSTRRPSPTRTPRARRSTTRAVAGGDDLPGAGRPTLGVPLHAGLPHRGRQDRQGAGLAQRPDALPQPRRLDLRRRVRDVRRLLRPRRPVHRAARGRQRA